MRIVSTLALIAGAIAAAMAALVFFVEPTPRRTVVDVPLNRPVAPPAQTAADGALRP